MGLKNLLIGLIVLTIVISLVVVFSLLGAGITGNVSRLSFILDNLSIGILGLIILILLVLLIELIRFRRRFI